MNKPIIIKPKRIVIGSKDDVKVVEIKIKPYENRNRPEGWYKSHAESRKFIKPFCEACGFPDKLHTHHIDGDWRNNKEANIQTLCTYCHNYLHRIQKRLGWTRPGAFPMFGEAHEKAIKIKKETS